MRVLPFRSPPLAVLFIAPALALLEPTAHAARPPEGSTEPLDQATEGYYLDPERGPTAFEPEYQRWFDGSRRPARYGRTALELTGVLAIGTSYYWIVSDPNKQDWDYIDLRDRSLHVEVKFDNNMFR